MSFIENNHFPESWASGSDHQRNKLLLQNEKSSNEIGNITLTNYLEFAA